MPDFETIFYEPSPDGATAAIVEQDDRVAYFYLHEITDEDGSSSPENRPGLQACWLRNLVPGPIAFDVEEMQRGVPPILPRLHCTHPEGLDPLEENRLSVIWFEEGRGAAIAYDDQIEAIIPPWSGVDGFHGFARSCKSPNQVCWPFPRDRNALERLDEAKRFWKLWDKRTPWPALQKQLLERYETSFGAHTQYYAIDGNRWPPKAIAEFNHAEVTIFLTLGVSIRPQPSPTATLMVPAEFRRIELGMTASGTLSSTDRQQILQTLSSAANYPWYAQHWLAPGHTYPFQDSAAPGEGRFFPRVIFANDERLAPQLPPLRFHTDPIETLWLFPMLDNELKVLDQIGPEAIVERFAEARIGTWNQLRPAVGSAGAE